MTTDFFTEDEVAALGLAACGPGAKISRRAVLLSPQHISVGAHSRIDAFALLSGSPAGLNIGRNVHISAHVSVLGRGRVEIGDFCTVSVRCAVFSSNDDYSGATMTNPTVPAAYRGAVDGPVVLGPHAILGCGAVVLPNVTVGASAAVGAMSLVKHDVPAFAVVAGTPARVVGERQRRHLELAALYLADEADKAGGAPG